MFIKGKIIIIDDNEFEANQLRDKLKKYLGDEMIHIFTYFAHDYLYSNRIDILFLDIDLGEETNGIDEAIKLRDKQRHKMDIVFVSWMDGLIHSSLHARPTFFIRKEFIDQDLQDAFMVLEKSNYREHLFIDTSHDRILLKNVMYIESEDNDVLIHVNDDMIIRERATLIEYEEELRGKEFIRCHNSYLVNIRFVRNKINNTLVMKNEFRIHISNTYLKSFNAFYRDYMLRED